jgi:hypothetical protein
MNNNVLYNNRSNRVIINKCKTTESSLKKIDYSEEDKEFQKKIDELRKFANIESEISNENIKKKLSENSNQEPLFSETITKEKEKKNVNLSLENNKNNLNECLNTEKKMNVNVNEVSSLFSGANMKENTKFTQQNLIYGIKKTILSDMNHLYQSSNSNDFKIGLNKKGNQKGDVFDCFYLFPNISEINTKAETNIINEKMVKQFNNKNEQCDNQYFPLDFIAPGITVPLKTKDNIYSKLVIKNIYWNIFQSINREHYTNNELLCHVPDRNDFVYKKIKLHVNFELHAQISNSTLNMVSNKILPYRVEQLKNICPSDSCLYKSTSIEIGSLNGSYFEDIEINLLKELNIDCCLLCLKVSVPDYCSDILKGFDKNSKTFSGNVPFGQFILNLTYELQ